MGLLSDKPRYFSHHTSTMKNPQKINGQNQLNMTFSTTKTNGFKEFRIANDLKEIDKWLDQKEMYMEEHKKEFMTEGGGAK